jgi:hypothetical protein
VSNIRFDTPRMAREADTVEAMIRVYCRGQHGRPRGELCDECALLEEYARLRLSKCRFQENKTTCGKCPVHCYKPEMRQQIREVMRYAGPRMMFHHPLMAVRHVLDGRCKPPARKTNVS